MEQTPATRASAAARMKRLAVVAVSRMHPLIQLRWLAVGGQVATILFVHFVLEIALPLRPMLGILAALVVFNLRASPHVPWAIPTGIAYVWLGMNVEKAPMSLHSLVTLVVDTLRPLAEDKHLSLASSLGPGVPEFMSSDEHKLRQILINLIGNLGFKIHLCWC